MRYLKVILVVLMALFVLNKASAATPIGVTFDDGKSVTYVNAAKVLSSRGIHATFFLIPDRLGTAGYMSWDNARNLATAGNEIGDHGPHVDMTALSQSSLYTQLSSTKKNLESKLGIPIKTMAYPFGDYNSSVQQTVASTGFQSAAAVSWEGDAPYNSLPIKDKYAIARKKVHSNTTPSEVYSWIKDAATQGKFLVLVFHDIVTTTPKDDEEYRLSDFTAISDYIAKGIPTLTISQAVSSTPPPTPPPVPVPTPANENLIKNPGFDSGWLNWHQVGSGASIIDVTQAAASQYSPYPGKRLKIVGGSGEYIAYTDDIKLPDSANAFIFREWANITLTKGRFGIWIDELDASGNYIGGKEIGGFTANSAGSALSEFKYQRSSSKVSYIAINIYSESGTTGTGLFDSCYFGQ
jgi:peptidoglycan/xylan/chitin deacetylase (PgdA/CDA1 family)